MAAATLDQVLTSLNGVYDPQIQSVQNQIAALPSQTQSQVQAADAAKNNAFDQITNAARARGTGVAFGGIPLQEQAQYTASTYAPAIAKLYSDQNTQQLTLQDAINKINEDRMNTAQGIYDNGVKNDLAQQGQDLEQQKLAEQIREYNHPQTSSSGINLASLFPAGQTPSTPQPQYIGNNDLRGHLNYLAQRENNQDAAVALHYVGNDGKYWLNPYITNPAVIAALTRLGATNTWRPGVTSSGPGQTIQNVRPSSDTNRYGGGTAGLGRL